MMKRVTKYYALGLLGLLFFYGCELGDGDYTETLILDSEVTSISDCKVHILEKTASTDFKADAKVSYQYNEETQELTLTHENAAFNCCPGTVFTSALLYGNYLIVAESEETAGCNCTCLYDLTVLVKEVEKRAYILKIKEPYLGYQEQISFAIDLSKSVSGSVTVTRQLYPWVG